MLFYARETASLLFKVSRVKDRAHDQLSLTSYKLFGNVI